jgi:hypothetical protein
MYIAVNELDTLLMEQLVSARYRCTLRVKMVAAVCCC